MIPVLVAALLVAASPADTVYTVDGGRITGTVLEESPAAGVTIQTPDGAVRRIDRAQISRIEFADGTVSNVRPPAPPAEPAPAAKPAAAEGALDSVYFRAGGRARGTVMEESGTTVKVRLLDGSIRAYGFDEVSRIEYADGTVSTPRAAPARTVEAAPAPAPRKAVEAPAPVDVVYFLGGGRVRGTVIEENPKTGVKVRLLDGTLQTYARDDLVQIEYADGSVSRRVMPAAAPAPAPVAPPVIAPQPQPTLAPPAPAPAPPLREEKPQLFPVYVALGVGATFIDGDAETGVSMSSVFEGQQAHASGEIGLRLSPAFALGVYGDVGGGEPARAVRDYCSASGIDCTATTGHFGFLVRHTWSPLSRRPIWLSLGTGWEFGGVMIDHRGDGNGSDLFSYTGREYVRVGAGVDFRSNDVLAFGLYGAVSAGEYDRFKDPSGVTTSIERAGHTTAQVGLRLTLFP